MSPELLITLLSSSVISGLIGALVAGWFNLRSKQSEYENAYYKLVLERRVSAYDQVERLVTQIKLAVVGNDSRPYHLLFSDPTNQNNAYMLLGSVMSSGLWLSDDLFDSVHELNVLIFTEGPRTEEQSLIEFGKVHYKTVAELRSRIEKLHARDMLSLHKIPSFLKTRNPTGSYIELSPAKS